MKTRRRWLMLGCLAAAAAFLAGCGEGVAGSQREPRSPSSIRDNTQLAGGANQNGSAEGEAGPPPLPMIRDVALQPGLAFALVPDALVVISLADPAKPEVVGRLVLAKTPLRMAIAGGHAWIACDEGGLQVVSLAQPRTPQLVGAWAPEVGAVTRVAVNDTMAIVGVPGRGISLLDASDPAQPTEQKAVAYTQDIADVALQGDQAYVLADKVYLLNVEKPSEAEQVGEYAIKQPLLAAAPIGEQTLLLTSASLQLANFRAPARPRPVSDLTFAAVAEALEPKQAVETDTAAETPVAEPTSDAAPTGEHHASAMLAADEVTISATPELATAPDAPAGGHAAAGITSKPKDDQAEDASEKDGKAVKPQADARLWVVGKTILLLANGQVTVLELQEQKTLVPVRRVPQLTAPAALDLLGERLVVGQGDGLVNVYKLTAEDLVGVGSLKLNEQVSTESLPTGPEPLPVSEGQRDAMKNTPQPSTARPKGAPDPA